MILHVFSLVAILTLGSIALYYRQRSILSEGEKAAQYEKNAQDKQTIALLKAEIESVRNHALALYVELQEAAKDAAKFRFLFRFFEKEASALASRVDALSAARLAAEKKELGARMLEFVFGWFFGGGRRGPSYG